MMHLTIDEIIEFVSIGKITDDTILTIQNVNSHIAKCDECREKVEAFTAVYDEFVSLFGCEKDLIFTPTEIQKLMNMDSKEFKKYIEAVIDKASDEIAQR